MAHYGKREFEDTHENMHLRRYERKFRGHKLAVAVGRNRALRRINRRERRVLAKE